MYPQGLVTYPGITQFLNASMTLTHGVLPSVCTIDMAPQSQFPSLTGTLKLTYDSTVIQFDGCRLDKSAFTRDERGRIQRVNIWDRRWKWMFGSVSGNFNTRRPNGSIRELSRRTPQWLAQYLLASMGETFINVFDLPNDAIPEIAWEHELPAVALMRLVSSLGCTVVLQLDGQVAIRRIGQGAALPEGQKMDDEIAVDPPEMPDVLSVACGETLFQVHLDLEPVALEVTGDNSGKYVPINEVSYRPSPGWANLDPMSYYDKVYGETVAPDDRLSVVEAAYRSAFRAYRVKVPFFVPLWPDPVALLDNVELHGFKMRPDVIGDLQYVNEQAAFGQLSALGIFEYRIPPTVHGIFYREWGGKDANEFYDNTATQQTPSPTRQMITRSFSIDAENRVVLFSDPMYMLLDDGSSFAQLRLNTTISISTATTGEKVHYRYDTATGAQNNTARRVIHRPDLFVSSTAFYGNDYTLSGSTDNRADVDLAAIYYTNLALQEYQVTDPQIVRYPELRAITLDGAIKQVSWYIGPGGTVTIAARNNERTSVVRPYRDQKFLMGTKAAQDEARRSTEDRTAEARRIDKGLKAVVSA